MTTLLYNQGAYNVGTYGGIGDRPTTYTECLLRIAEAEYISVKISLISLLPDLRGEGNPDYRTGIQVLNGETNEIVIDLLKNQVYKFVQELTDEEKDAFNYLSSGYIENNPGIQGNSFKSYIGVYIDDEGNRTDEQDL